MSLTKIGSIGINTGISFAGVTTIATLNASDNVLSVGGTVNFVSDVSIGGTVSIAGTLTYEDVTNVDAVGLITARDGIIVGSGITLSVDGDGFFTGVITATSFSGIDLGAVTGATGDFSIADKIVHTGDTDTALRFPSADTITAETGGTERLRITSDGKYQFPGTGGGSGSRGLEIDTETIGATDEGVILNARASGTTGQIKLQTNSATALTVEGNGGNINVASNLKVTGVCTATSYTGDGSALTGIAVGVATAVATGITGITTVLDLSKNDHKITVSGITTVDVRGGTEGDSHSLRIINSGITTVGFSTYFLFPSGSSPIIPTADGTLSMISFTVHRQGAVGLATQLFAGASVNFS